jgi:hypothetical protein
MVKTTKYTCDFLVKFPCLESGLPAGERKTEHVTVALATFAREVPNLLLVFVFTNEISCEKKLLVQNQVESHEKQSGCPWVKQAT